MESKGGFLLSWSALTRRRFETLRSAFAEGSYSRDNHTNLPLCPVADIFLFPSVPSIKNWLHSKSIIMHPVIRVRNFLLIKTFNWKYLLIFLGRLVGAIDRHLVVWQSLRMNYTFKRKMLLITTTTSYRIQEYSLTM